MSWAKCPKSSVYQKKVFIIFLVHVEGSAFLLLGISFLVSCIWLDFDLLLPSLFFLFLPVWIVGKLNDLKACWSQVCCPLVVNSITSQWAAEILNHHREKSHIVFGEVLAAALALDGSCNSHPCWLKAAGSMAEPPLRSEPTSPERLCELLAS